MASRRLITTISRQATIFLTSPSSFPKSHFVQPLKTLIPFTHFHTSTFRAFSSKPSKFAIKPAVTAFEGGTYDFGDDDDDDEGDEGDDGDSSGADDDDVDGNAGRRSVLEPERIEERSYYKQRLLREAADIGYKVIGPLKPEDRVFKRYQPAFAVVQIGSHQFKVSNEDAIYVEKLKYCEVNDKLLLNKVMMLGSPTQTIIGRPILPEAAVHAVVEEHALDAKVIIFKKKRRKNYRRTKGHRQELTRLRITNIQGLEKSKAPVRGKTVKSKAPVRGKTVKSSAKKVEKKAVPAQIES